jgi:hypothetical protein
MVRPPPMVMENCLTAVFAVGVVLSVNWILNRNVPAVFGKPLIVPVVGEEVSVKPGGNGEEPAASDQEYGGSPPFPVSVELYEELTAPLASELVLILSAGSMVSANIWVAVTWLVSVTWIVKLDVAAVPGRPLITPVPEFNERPPGKDDPALTAHV